MRIIKTALGWEIRPENNKEESHVRWLIEHLQREPAVESGTLPCPRCSTFGNYDGRACLACGFNYRNINEVIANAAQARTFTTKGPVE